MSDQPKKKGCDPEGCGCIAKKKSAPQNGKGDAPRNISTKFRHNYDSINWKMKKK